MTERDREMLIARLVLVHAWLVRVERGELSRDALDAPMIRSTIVEALETLRPDVVVT